jgi:hypothetical protein
MTVDTGLCLSGLADVWAARGDEEMAAACRAQARTAWASCGARLYVERG